MLNLILGYYWWYNGVPDNDRKIHKNANSIFRCVYFEDVVHSLLFPAVVDIAHFAIFNDAIFMSYLIAVNHLGATFGGIFGAFASCLKLDWCFSKIPLFSSIFSYLHLVMYGLYHQNCDRKFHMLWHIIYHANHSLLQVCLSNLLVNSVESDKIPRHLAISAGASKLGHMVGQLLLIFIWILPKSKLSPFVKTPLKIPNIEYIYLVATLLSAFKVAACANLFDFQSDFGSVARNLGRDKAKRSRPLKAAEFTNGDSVAEPINRRCLFLPFAMLTTDVLSLIGAGISIRFIAIYIIEKFKTSYVGIWLSSVAIPLVTATLIFFMDNQARRYGWILTIFLSKLVALILLYLLPAMNSVHAVLIIHILRAAFQNAPSALKTAAMLRFSKPEAFGYWIASGHVSRFIMFASTLLGGRLADGFGVESCFYATGTLKKIGNLYFWCLGGFYLVSQILLLLCLLMCPEVY